MPRTQRTGRGIRLFAQPLPSVEPALLLAALVEELDDRVLPAFERADFDGLLMLFTSFHVTREDGTEHRQTGCLERPTACASSSGREAPDSCARWAGRADVERARATAVTASYRTRLSHPVDASSLGA